MSKKLKIIISDFKTGETLKQEVLSIGKFPPRAAAINYINACIIAKKVPLDATLEYQEGNGEVVLVPNENQK